MQNGINLPPPDRPANHEPIRVATRARPDPPVQSPSPVINSPPAPSFDQELEEALQDTNDLLQPLGVTLRFRRDQSTGNIIVQLVDQDSGETLRQIPCEGIVRLSISLTRLQIAITHQVGKGSIDMASGTSFSGLGSGIDFGVISDAIITNRSRPLNQLTVKQATFQGRAEGLKQFNAKLIAFNDAVKALTDQSISSGRSALSSASNISASVVDSAVPATYNVEVTRLATSLSQASTDFASTQTAVLAGTATTATFELRKGGATTGTPITIDSTNNTLAGLRDAINAAKAGVNATIVDISGNGSQQQLVLNSTDAGSANRVELVETTNTGTATALNLRTLTPSTGNFADLDASLKINGLTITRSSNSISDAITGVTLNLGNTGNATITVAASSQSLKGKIDNFVKSYNDLQDYIATQVKPDANGKPTGALAADSTFRSTQNILRNITDASADNGGALKTLAQVGITRDGSNKLVVDNTALSDKLTNSFADVKALFAGNAGGSGVANAILTSGTNLTDTIKNAITGFTTSIDGLSKSIAEQQSRLELLRGSLNRHFAAVDAAIGQLNGQGTALTNIVKSLQPSNK